MAYPHLYQGLLNFACQPTLTEARGTRVYLHQKMALLSAAPYPLSSQEDIHLALEECQLYEDPRMLASIILYFSRLFSRLYWSPVL